MKLKVRNENRYEEIELNSEDTEKLWIALELGDIKVSKSEKEKKIQEAYNEQFNKPEYNNWHKFNRHIVPASGLIQGDEELDVCEVMDLFSDNSFERRYEKEQEDKEICEKIRGILKPKQAELIIDICVKQMRPADIAKRDGVSKPAVSQRLDTAIKNLKQKCPTPKEFKNFLKNLNF